MSLIPGERAIYNRDVPVTFVRAVDALQAIVRIGEDTRVVPLALLSEDGV